MRPIFGLASCAPQSRGDDRAPSGARRRARTWTTWTPNPSPPFGSNHLEAGLVRVGPSDLASAERVAHDLLRDERPTAIFAGNNRTCIGVLRAVTEAGASVAVVGFDDFELADMLAQPASVISHDTAEMGR